MSTQYKKEESVGEIILFVDVLEQIFFFKVKKGLCFLIVFLISILRK